jgi:4-hydroxy-tetrahydrodipicolinate reductase
MNTPLRIVQYGLGPIGQETARTVLDKDDAHSMTLVGAIDIDPGKVGRDVADVIGDGEPAVVGEHTGTLVHARRLEWAGARR